MIEETLLNFLFHDSTWRTLPEIAYHSGMVKETGFISKRGREMARDGMLEEKKELRTDEHNRPITVSVYRLSPYGESVRTSIEKKKINRIQVLDLTGYYS